MLSPLSSGLHWVHPAHQPGVITYSSSLPSLWHFQTLHKAFLSGLSGSQTYYTAIGSLYLCAVCPFY